MVLIKNGSAEEAAGREKEEDGEIESEKNPRSLKTRKQLRCSGGSECEQI
jgi:hypothetical protein